MIKLQNSHVVQITKGADKTDWSVQENETNNELFVLPKHYTDSEVFHIMDTMKEYELVAFNRGIEFQKGKQNAVLNDTIKANEKVISFLKGENNKLASALDNIHKR